PPLERHGPPGIDPELTICAPCLKSGRAGKPTPAQAASSPRNTKHSSHFSTAGCGAERDFLPQSLGTAPSDHDRAAAKRSEWAIGRVGSSRLACPLLHVLALSWWLGFRIGFDGWSKSCRLRGRNLLRARRDKIPGDLSGQELACLWSMPISRGS